MAKAKEREDIGINQEVPTQELHCVQCGRFLGFYAIIWGFVKIKCPRCKTWNTIDIRPTNEPD